MVFFLPVEFKAPSGEEAEQAMAQLCVDPMQAVFDKPEDKEHKHLGRYYSKDTSTASR
jgi:hypothetical protein